MNAIHKIIAINEKELLSNVSDAASWHADYRDTPYIYIGNLHEDLKEKDVVVIFSQYGNPTHVNLIKDKETGKSRGFCYLKYEDHRSCVLAIDNFNGVKVYDRPLKVDHTYYRLVDGQNEDDFLVEYPKVEALTAKESAPAKKPKLLEYQELEINEPTSLDDEDNFDDPMANFDMKDAEKRHSLRSSREKRHRRHHHLDRPSKRSSRREADTEKE